MKVTSNTFTLKNFFFLLLIIIESSLYGQTDSIEKAVINAKFLSKEISQEEFSKIGLEWHNMMKIVKGYPDLPLNQNGQVQYIFLKNYKNVSKAKLFHRVLESLTINYGLLPVNLYSNLEDGKIIFNNSFLIDAIYSCNYMGVITIKDEKMLIEYIKIGYQAYYPGRESDTGWIPEQTSNISFDHFYPIILKKISEWKWHLNLFKTTNENFKKEVDRMDVYLVDYDSNYIF